LPRLKRFPLGREVKCLQKWEAWGYGHRNGAGLPKCTLTGPARVHRLAPLAGLTSK